MKEKERKLFKALCKFKDDSFDISLTDFASPSVLGHIFFNRMQGVAYDTLKRNGILGKVNREFRNSLNSAYEQNVQKNESFLNCIKMLSDILAICDFNVAMLKGAFLCAHYPVGYRTSNDVDLLVLPKDVTLLGTVLTNHGFKQGNVRNGTFIPATRQEIVSSKMLRGETVPYIKEVNLPFMKFFEIDINFSLDYKNGNDDILADILSKVCFKEVNGITIPTLNDEDFFIHLCAHLYKEATTLPWIEMHRDMTLYKYCDIYMLLFDMSEHTALKVFERAKNLGMEKICAYTILETMEIFEMNNAYTYKLAHESLNDDFDFRLRVISPSDKKTFMYQTKDASERFFMEERATDLKEVSNDADA